MKKETKQIIFVGLIFLILCSAFFYFDDKFTNINRENSNEPVSIEEHHCIYPIELSIDLGNSSLYTNDNFFEGDIISIEKYNFTLDGGCFQHRNLKYNDLKDILITSKTYINTTDNNKMKEYLNKNKYFYVENPNTQISAEGSFSGTGTSNTDGYEYGFFISKIDTFSKIEFKGNLNINGELKTPYSFISERDFNELVKKNSNEFVKCFNSKIENVNLKDGSAFKLFCGIEKNNVFVVSEIESSENLKEGCKELEIPIYRFIGEYKLLENKPKYVPSERICSEIWVGR